MTLLDLKGIDIFYGPAQALWGVSFSVEQGPKGLQATNVRPL
jgi:ABC-type arginine transport system ATPase subunit